MAGSRDRGRSVLLLAILLLAACRRDTARPIEGAASPGAALPAGAPPALDDGPPPGDYAVSDEEVRRATYLTRAVLIFPSPAFDDAVPRLFAESGVRFLRLAEDERFGQYQCGAVAESEARPWMSLAAAALATHAPALLRRSGTRWIALCAGLRQGDTPRSMIPAGSAGTILIDARITGSEAFFAAGLHHELFHMLDHADPGLVGSEQWSGLNAPGSAYGPGGRHARQASGRLGSGTLGFVSAYAESGVEEDKAEVFRFLVVDPVGLAGLAAQDDVVAAKRDFLLRAIGPLCAGRPGAAACRERRG